MFTAAYSLCIWSECTIKIPPIFPVGAHMFLSDVNANPLLYPVFAMWLIAAQCPSINLRFF